MNLKTIGKVFTSKFVGTGPPSYGKRFYRAAVSQRLRITDLKEGTLFYREAGHASEWKPILPACLEERVIQYTHTSLGHLGVEK